MEIMILHDPAGNIVSSAEGAPGFELLPQGDRAVLRVDGAALGLKPSPGGDGGPSGHDLHAALQRMKVDVKQHRLVPK